MKVINRFSVKQGELDFAFAQRYFPHKSETAPKACLQCVCFFNVERTSLKFSLIFRGLVGKSWKYV